MNNINPINVIHSLINNLTPEFEITIHANPYLTYILKKDVDIFILSDGDYNDILNNDNIIIIKNFFINLDITEIDLHNLILNTTEEIFLCEGNDCYYQRNKNATKIQKKWKSYKFNKQKKRLMKNIRNRETGLPFSFGKTTYKNNLKYLKLDIKYLKLDILS